MMDSVLLSKEPLTAKPVNNNQGTSNPDITATSSLKTQYFIRKDVPNFVCVEKLC